MRGPPFKDDFTRSDAGIASLPTDCLLPARLTFVTCSLGAGHSRVLCPSSKSLGRPDGCIVSSKHPERADDAEF